MEVYGITISVQCFCIESLLKTIHIPRSHLDFTFSYAFKCSVVCWSAFNLLIKLSVLLWSTGMNENYHINHSKQNKQVN